MPTKQEIEAAKRLLADARVCNYGGCTAQAEAGERCEEHARRMMALWIAGQFTSGADEASHLLSFYRRVGRAKDATWMEGLIATLHRLADEVRPEAKVAA